MDINAEIDAWFATHFHNSVVSRDTETYNHVRAAVDDLKVRLAHSVAPQPTAPEVAAAD